MKFILSTVLLWGGFFFGPARILAQNSIKSYVRRAQVNIRSISPDSVDYADLEAVGAAIGDSRVVMLGEQDHGDAPTFLAKTRLIKYLHEKKGFKVLVFEGDFFALNRGWEQLSKDKEAIDSFLFYNISSVWTLCPACRNLLFDYIPLTYATPDPLIVSGLDMQFFGRYSLSGIQVNQMDSMVRVAGLPIVTDPGYAKEISPLIRTWFTILTDSIKFDKCFGYFKKIRDQFTEKLGKDSFWTIVAENMVQFDLMMHYMKLNKANADSIRDPRMALNLRWLMVQKFPHEKMMVWAANSHITKWVSGPPAFTFKDFVPMGGEFTRDPEVARQTYVLGFTSFKGTAGRVGSRTETIYRPKANGFERWIDPSSAFSFVDFRKYNQQMSDPYAEQFQMSGYGHLSREAPWNKLFDGIFFIREMYSCNNYHP